MHACTVVSSLCGTTSYRRAGSDAVGAASSSGSGSTSTGGGGRALEGLWENTMATTEAAQTLNLRLGAAGDLRSFSLFFFLLFEFLHCSISAIQFVFFPYYRGSTSRIPTLHLNAHLVLLCTISQTCIYNGEC